MHLSNATEPIKWRSIINEISKNAYCLRLYLMLYFNSSDSPESSLYSPLTALDYAPALFSFLRRFFCPSAWFEPIPLEFVSYDTTLETLIEPRQCSKGYKCIFGTGKRLYNSKNADSSLTKGL